MQTAKTDWYDLSDAKSWRILIAPRSPAARSRSGGMTTGHTEFLGATSAVVVFETFLRGAGHAEVTAGDTFLTKTAWDDRLQ